MIIIIKKIQYLFWDGNFDISLMFVFQQLTVNSMSARKDLLCSIVDLGNTLVFVLSCRAETWV